MKRLLSSKKDGNLKKEHNLTKRESQAKILELLEKFESGESGVHIIGPPFDLWKAIEKKDVDIPKEIFDDKFLLKLNSHFKKMARRVLYLLSTKSKNTRYAAYVQMLQDLGSVVGIKNSRYRR